MKDRTIEDMKNVLIEGMRQNFEKDGFLAPVWFTLLPSGLNITPIPIKFFDNDSNKDALMVAIRKWCEVPEVKAVGLIHEAFAVTLKDDSEMLPLLQNGNLRVSDLRQRKDMIFLVVSTPEEEEFIAFYVDPISKRILESLPPTPAKGRFSDFFQKRIKFNLKHKQF